jgi:hypothetical protein
MTIFRGMRAKEIYLSPNYSYKVGFYNIFMDFIDFMLVIEDVWPILGDIGSFFRPDLGRKLGDGYQI